ncbi:hypothetical protein METBIDRAFT_37487 [Metschnikowia bicuspidata var. bicuspidata NRRL YB-4993]|uniref:alpha-1,2-Mannosidase n=1 Tax=Metschnikowia bicuspidata var. bicuspidata NRRL YB-4993 TaxID=869754 RepID=A0A1A0HK52_9ASCO|nr:hypothetical protein METBIDRAFT_37487 [Metschnikowia bicuspidata var. bicuspidata NRRL YB-4993]OBA24381.1 hypothetical protein METBIDRAFT_37487 [Metschnikowia bicuspidata var. bicuspidata NRRL YB-4993]
MNLTPLFFYVVLVVSLDPLAHSAFTPRHLRELQHRTKLLFQHGWHSYMEHGFPADEVKPISCVAYGPQHTLPDDLHKDVLGNVSLTVLDNLDTLIMMHEWDELETVLHYLKVNQKGYFDQDHVVQVFEASIRWLGGLLLAHLALSELDWQSGPGQIQAIVAGYNGFLLEMAYDLGLRLIPAYKTSSSLPLPRINLAKGLDAVPSAKNREACTAGAATPFMEFSLLLRLTGDERFETLTRLTFNKLWAARLSLGLLPMSLDPIGSRWLDVITGVGALIDSFYEYALKGAILFNDDHLWDIFSQSYQSLISLLAFQPSANGWTYFANIHTTSAARVTAWIDLLSAFWPGLQVLAGRLSDAVSSHLVFLKIWDHFDSIPERWDSMAFGMDHLLEAARLLQAVPLEWYPLRPEFIESTYYLYRATKEPMYLQIGLRMLDLFETRFKAECGFSGYQDIRTGSRQDRMETFVLGELLKYLYLLFDEANESYVHSATMHLKNWVFSTEAHPLWLTKEVQQRSQKLFASSISPEITQLKDFKGRGFLGSMWRGLIHPLNELESDLDEHDEQSHVREVSPFGSDLQPAFSHLLSCEIRPSQWKSDRQFFGSGYYEWDWLFSPNEAMAGTLIRPEHLRLLDDNSTIELQDSFLAIHGLSPYKKCALASTTTITEYQIGPLMRPEEYNMYRVNRNSSLFPFAESDLVMPELRGRFRMEHLKKGAIDNCGVTINTQYLHGMLPTNPPGVSFSQEISRVNFINGLQIAPGTTLWIRASYLGSNPNVFIVTNEGDVYMTGKYVENLKVY